MTNRLTTGDAAPNFTLVDASGSVRSLADYRGRNVVVYFYPKAATPGCTTEACDFRDNLSSLKAAGYDVVGISPDPVEKLADFAADNSLSFPILSDPDAAVASRWGAWGDKVINGTTMTGVLRSTVVVAGNGTVRFAEYQVDAIGHVSALRKTLGIDEIPSRTNLTAPPRNA